MGVLFHIDELMAWNAHPFHVDRQVIVQNPDDRFEYLALRAAFI